MTGVRGLAGSLLVVVLSGSLPGVCPARDPAWEAVDRLDAALIPAPGWWGESGLRNHEALRGEIEAWGVAGMEPRRGVGGGFGWRRVLVEGGTGGNRPRAWLVLRGNRGRLGVTVAQDRWGRHRRSEIETDFRGRLGEGWLAGFVLRLYPGEATLAPWTRFSLAAARGDWLGLLEAGPTPGAVAMTLGLKTRAGMIWNVGVVDGFPVLGLQLRWSRLELRLREERHPRLGRGAEARLRWGGNAP